MYVWNLRLPFRCNGKFHYHYAVMATLGSITAVMVTSDSIWIPWKPVTFFGLGWYTTSLPNGIETGEVEVVEPKIYHF